MFFDTVYIRLRKCLRISLYQKKFICFVYGTVSDIEEKTFFKGIITPSGDKEGLGGMCGKGFAWISDKKIARKRGHGAVLEVHETREKLHIVFKLIGKV